jgi:hypothetical protein
MSDENTKNQHSRRLHQDQVAIDRQITIAKNYDMHRNTTWKYIDQPHRNHKKAILNCGDPKCYMCMNPRRADGEETIQERRHKQDLEQVRNRHNNGNPPDEHI